MIFNVPWHIEMIRNGLPSPKDHYIVSRTHYPTLIVKTQTRRLNRGYYKLESERKKPHDIGYAVQRKRGAKGEPDIRIVMDRIWKEDCLADDELGKGGFFVPISMSEEDARAEGGYTPEEFEKTFRKINSNWTGIIRYGFEFHVIEVRR